MSIRTILLIKLLFNHNKRIIFSLGVLSFASFIIYLCMLSDSMISYSECFPFYTNTHTNIEKINQKNEMLTCNVFTGNITEIKEIQQTNTDYSNSYNIIPIFWNFENKIVSEKTKKNENNTKMCPENEECIKGIVSRVIDGDTLDVNDTRIRLSLINTPEIGQEGYERAKNFVKLNCGIGSTAIIDIDDGQRQGSYGRIIGTVYCNDSDKSLNELLLDTGNAYLLENICERSEFSTSKWATRYGC